MDARSLRPCLARVLSGFLGDRVIGRDLLLAFEIAEHCPRQHLAEIHDLRREILDVAECGVGERLIVSARFSSTMCTSIVSSMRAINCADAGCDDGVSPCFWRRNA